MCGIYHDTSIMHKLIVQPPTKTYPINNYYCEVCKNNADDTLSVHGIVLGAIVAWKNEENNELFVEVVIDGEHQVDGQGNFITTVTAKGAIEETHMTSVVAFRNAPDTEWIMEDIDLDVSELDRLASVFTVEIINKD
jgi:hypothetical protein